MHDQYREQENYSTYKAHFVLYVHALTSFGMSQSLQISFMAGITLTLY